jgi:hypothetical protein
MASQPAVSITTGCKWHQLVFWWYLANRKSDWGDSKCCGNLFHLSTTFVFWPKANSKCSYVKTGREVFKISVTFPQPGWEINNRLLIHSRVSSEFLKVFSTGCEKLVAGCQSIPKPAVKINNRLLIDSRVPSVSFWSFASRLWIWQPTEQAGCQPRKLCISFF